jgi:single-strand DNA-binding protein
MNFNKIFLGGHLTRDPEVRYTPNGTAVAETGLAINRTWTDNDGQKQEETTFVDLTFWGRTAEIAQEYLRKGRAVFIEGRLRQDSWEDKQTGQKRSRLRVSVENMQMLGPKTEASQQQPPAGQPPPARSAPPPPQQPRDPGFDESDIPF